MYNVTKKNEGKLLHSKLNKLVTLIRKAADADKVDELVADID